MINMSIYVNYALQPGVLQVLTKKCDVFLETVSFLTSVVVAGTAYATQ